MSFGRYPAYKDSGISWIGMIPEHWSVSRAKNLFALMKRDPEEGDEIVTAFRDGEVTLRSNRRVEGFTNAIQEHGYQRILPGDLVIHAMDAFAGAIGVSDSTGKSTPVYSVCTPKVDGIRSHYYGRLLRHMAMVGFINSLSKGIRERSTEFRWSEASELLLVVPPLDEQTRIAAFLDRETATIDGLVAEQQRLIDLLKEKRQAVISHAVTKGLNPAAPMKPSGIEWLGDVPAHWRVCLLKKAFRSVDYGISDSLNSEGSIAILRMGNIENGKVITDDLKYTDAVDPALLLVHGDLLYNRTNSLDLIGKVGMFLGGIDIPVSFASYLVRLRIMDDSIPEFFAYLLNTDGILGLARANAFVAIGQCNLNPTRYGQIIVAIPPKDEQATITEHLTAETARIDALTAEAQRAIDLLQERRTALISAAVTGQIDVRHLAEAGAA